MIQKVFCVYDSKAEAYNSPLYVQSKGQAVRSFAEVANDKTSEIGKWPADFTLFELGEYNTDNGKFDLFDTPRSVCVAIEMITPATI